MSLEAGGCDRCHLPGFGRRAAKAATSVPARAPRQGPGAPIGEIFTFLSGLYFRGKLAYAAAFARPPRGLNSTVFVITPNR
jgi:hypothetical protein